jgi:L-fucose mutarotase
MLKGIDNRLNADVLYALRAMGHGDVLVICDTNFPADSIARHTALGELLHMDNLSCAEAAEAILSVLPLDTFVDDFAGRMEVVGQPSRCRPCRRGADVIDRPTVARPAWSASSASPSTTWPATPMP